MANKKTVKIKKDDLEGNVIESAVPAWERNGWTVVDDGDSETATEQPVVEPVQAPQQVAPKETRPEKQQP